jgi:hypothetical protein
VETVIIKYQGIGIEIPTFLNKYFPLEKPLDEWPTFCGPGGWIGDWLVPDKINGAYIAPACFIHDCERSVGPKTWESFSDGNNRMLKNTQALVNAQLDGRDRLIANSRCSIYHYAVASTVGWWCYKPEWDSDDPNINLDLREKLLRLGVL